MAAKSLAARRAAARLANATKLAKSVAEDDRRQRDAEDAARWRELQDQPRPAGLEDRLAGFLSRIANSPINRETNTTTGHMRATLSVKEFGPVVTRSIESRPLEDVETTYNRLRMVLIGDAVLELNRGVAILGNANAAAGLLAPEGRAWAISPDAGAPTPGAMVDRRDGVGRGPKATSKK